MKFSFQEVQKIAIFPRAVYLAASIVLGAGTAFAQKQELPGGRPPPPGPMIDSNRAINPAERITAAAPANAAPSNTATPKDVAPVRPSQRRRRPSYLKVCGNPQVPCKTDIKFQPYDLPFQMPATTTIYETELFYAVILKSVRATTGDDCQVFVPESDRLSAQTLFPNSKVFSSRCYEPGEVGYTNTSSTAHFMAVYGGMTLAEANRTLARVRATGKYRGANIRRMRAMINGT